MCHEALNQPLAYLARPAGCWLGKDKVKKMTGSHGPAGSFGVFLCALAVFQGRAGKPAGVGLKCRNYVNLQVWRWVPVTMEAKKLLAVSSRSRACVAQLVSFSHALAEDALIAVAVVVGVLPIPSIRWTWSGREDFFFTSLHGTRKVSSSSSLLVTAFAGKRRQNACRKRQSFLNDSSMLSSAKYLGSKK